ncbi:MAG: M48 family metallopeptidase [Methanobacterium sp.]|nr:M48 family metallopeptidase [Methanobacterium sp.]
MQKSFKIDNLNIKYDIIPRKVKYWRLEIKYGKLVLITPHGFRNYEKILEKHKKWIYRKLIEYETSKNDAKEKQLNFNRSEENFRQIINEYVQKFSNELNVRVNRVYFRKMKSRWGSCSSKRNISINRYLIYLPENLIEYLVFHEMAHLIELNHSKKFWAIIHSKFPDYKEIEKELSIYWFAVRETIIDKH